MQKEKHCKPSGHLLHMYSSRFFQRCVDYTNQSQHKSKASRAPLALQRSRVTGCRPLTLCSSMAEISYPRILSLFLF